MQFSIAIWLVLFGFFFFFLEVFISIALIKIKRKPRSSKWLSRSGGHSRCHTACQMPTSAPPDMTGRNLFRETSSCSYPMTQRSHCVPPPPVSLHHGMCVLTWEGGRRNFLMPFVCYTAPLPSPGVQASLPGTKCQTWGTECQQREKTILKIPPPPPTVEIQDHMVE
jgi:disulfide bond formation protein DsbB